MENNTKASPMDGVYENFQSYLDKLKNGPQGEQFKKSIPLINSFIITRKLNNDKSYIVRFFKGTKSTNIYLGRPNTDLATTNGIQYNGIDISNIDNIIIQGSFTLNEEGLFKSFRGMNGQVDVYGTFGADDRASKREDLLLYSSVGISKFPKFEGAEKFNPHVRELIGFFTGAFPIKPLKGFVMCDGSNYHDTFVYYNHKPKDWKIDEIQEGNEFCLSYHDTLRDKSWTYIGKSKGTNQWRNYSKDRELIEPNPPLGTVLGPNEKIFTNNILKRLSLVKVYGDQNAKNIIYVDHPSKIPVEDGGGYDCSGKPWIDDDKPIDSSLSGPIKDLLDKHNKTFYLIGKEEEHPQHKLYLFNLGDVVGTALHYNGIQKAVCYRNEKCEWVHESDNAQFKFSKARDDIDTSFYLLTMDKLPKPTPNVGTITHRKANEFLLKKFPSCSINRPEGKPNPDDTLKPDFGGGGTGPDGNGPPDDGSGGFFPDINRPLPEPDVPPCIGGDGSSQTPVSEIYLISVPELSPSYDNTYDFPSKQAQHAFFLSKSSKLPITKYSYLRKDQAIQIGSHVDNIHCYNYLMYKNKFGKWYYCFIMNKEYINERTTRITIATDVIQTYLFNYTVGPCYVERCHVPRWKSGDIPTDEYELEGLEFGEPMQETTYQIYKFSKTLIAVTSTPLGKIESRKKEVNA